jgi:hypothetical protein
MSAGRRAAIGLSVRTGRAAVVVIVGPLDAPEVIAKTRMQVAFTFDEGAVFHVAQDMPIDRARVFLREAEDAFVERARADLAELLAPLRVDVVAAGMVAPVQKKLPPLETILKAHPLVHAAEGELYRRVFAAAASTAGAEPTRVPADALARRVADALRLTPAELAARLSAMGKAAGRPWAAEHKQAALVAWLVLATAVGSAGKRT